MVALAGGSAFRESVTIDEVAHMGAGVSYLQKLDMRMNEEHPPLAKVIAAIPLVLRGAHADYTHLSWTFSEEIFNQFLGEWVFGHWFLMRWNDPQSTLLWARLPMLLLTLVLGLTIYVIGSRLGGRWGGLLCLTGYVTAPAFLTFGPLVLTDLAVTLFWVLTTWHLAEMWHSPGRGTLIMFGLVFAGALLSKFSSGLLFFVFAAVAVSMRLRPLPEQPVEKKERRAWRRRGWWNIAKGTSWAALFVYLTYFILSWNEATDSFSLIHFPASPVLRRLFMPVWLYLRGVALFAASAGSRPTYILGQAYPHGVWFYFPVLFLLKSQLAFLTLVLLAVLVALFVKRRGRAEIQALPSGMELQWRCLWVSLTVFTAACLLSRLDISIRHFLISMALITILLAPLPRMLQIVRNSAPKVAQTGIALTLVLAIVAVVNVVRAYPNYLPYLNALRMGRPGYLLVNDSNLDWNQALPEIERFARQHGLKQFLLDQYGFSEPDAWAPEAKLWNCQQPSATDAGEWAVVSANNLVDSHNCLWLMNYPHTELAAGSMLAVQLPHAIPVAGQLGGPPLPVDYRFLAGVPEFDVRPMFLACIRDPEKLEPTMDFIKTTMQRQQQKKRQP